jgi:hypothetical protein
LSRVDLIAYGFNEADVTILDGDIYLKPNIYHKVKGLAILESQSEKKNFDELLGDG